jgi:GTP-binding protein HflX
MKAISSSLNNERRISFITAALVIISLIGVVHHFQSCHAFVPASRTSASTTSTPSSSSSSYSRRHSLLYVASSPPPPPSAGKTIKDGDDDDDNEEPAPLFTLDSTTTTTTSQDGGDGLYQVEEDRDAPSPMPDIPGSLSLDTTTSDTIPSSEFIDEKQDDDVDQDFSFYDREEDDMLTEREDRLYTDGKGIRRKIERCILVGVEDLTAQRKAKKADLYYDPLSGEAAEPPCFSLEESMIEMRELIRTAGLELSVEIIQRQKEVNPKTYIGSGKVEEARKLMEEHDCCTIIFDAELSPGQQKSLENIFNKEKLENDFLGSDQDIKVIDRTALILDIFAQHAKTREGKLQVDLALHEYRKPRLTKMWTQLERQSGAGGVGLRGMGESQLEIDKRLIRDRIIVLKRKIDNVQKQRTIHRRGRKRTGLPLLSLVGYTNAGKSSVLNSLTRAGVMAESMLFATLDPTTRKVKLPGESAHPEFLLTDTVGFIQKLPTNLVAAFRATLEEVEEADVLVHVIDVANPAWEKQERAVLAVLSDMGVADKPIVRVLNKIDLLDEEDAEYLKYEAAFADKTVAVSALFGEGMEDFVEAVEESLNDMLVPIELVIPYSKGQDLSIIHEQGVIETLDYQPEGTYVLGRLPPATASRLEKYNVAGNNKSVDQTIDQASTDDNEIDWVAIGRGRHSPE